MNNFFSRSGNIVRVQSSRNSFVSDQLEPLTYSVKFDPRSGYFLEIIDNFTLPKKIYGNTKDRTEKVIKTFLSRPRGTGVMLSGFKGAGKTVQMKEISETLRTQYDRPIIVVNEAFHGDDFKTFIESITTSAVVVFDEFEKVYSEPEHAQAMLTLFDGVIETHKLWLLSMNSNDIDQNMINRPGRMFYHFEYDSMDEDVIKEVIDDFLIATRHKDRMIKIVDTMDAITMDILTSIIEEVNRFDLDPFEVVCDMNVNPMFLTNSTFDLHVIFDGKPVDESINRIRPSFVGCHPYQANHDFYLYASNAEGSVLKVDECKEITSGDSGSYLYLDLSEETDSVQNIGRGRYRLEAKIRNKKIEIIFSRKKVSNLWKVL